MKKKFKIKGKTVMIRPYANLFGAFIFVRQNYAVMLHRFQKYTRTLTPGYNIKIPFIDKIAFVQDLREQAIEIKLQLAVTKDNVPLDIDATLYIEITNPYKASYGVENVVNAIMNLAKTTMRAEIGKLTLDKTFEEREMLNKKIIDIITKETIPWGVSCKRYEIKGIEPPVNIKNAMTLEAKTEREKRATILNSEAERQIAINAAEGERKSKSLRAEGEAEAVIIVAEASANALVRIGTAISKDQRLDSASFFIADKYIDSYETIGKTSNSLLVCTSPIEVVKNINEAFDMLKKSLKGRRNTPDKPKASNQ